FEAWWKLSWDRGPAAHRHAGGDRRERGGVGASRAFEGSREFVDGGLIRAPRVGLQRTTHCVLEHFRHQTAVDGGALSKKLGELGSVRVRLQGAIQSHLAVAAQRVAVRVSEPEAARE